MTKSKNALKCPEDELFIFYLCSNVKCQAIAEASNDLFHMIDNKYYDRITNAIACICVCKL